MREVGAPNVACLLKLGTRALSLSKRGLFAVWQLPKLGNVNASALVFQNKSL